MEFDTDRNGAIEKRDTYTAAPGSRDRRVLAFVEFDFDQASRPAQRLHYKADGTFDRVEKLR